MGKEGREQIREKRYVEEAKIKGRIRIKVGKEWVKKWIGEGSEARNG